MYCGNSDGYLNVYYSGRVFSLWADKFQRRVCKIETRDRGDGQSWMQNYNPICRPREQESCLSEARISLLSAKGKARLVAGCSSGKYLTGVCVTVFPSRGKISRGNGGAKEQVQQGRTSREDRGKQRSSVAETVALMSEAYREHQVKWCLCGEYLCLGGSRFERQSQLQSNVCQREGLIDDHG
jgi:hypothetical protein